MMWLQYIPELDDTIRPIPDVDRPSGNGVRLFKEMPIYSAPPHSAAIVRHAASSSGVNAGASLGCTASLLPSRGRPFNLVVAPVCNKLIVNMLQAVNLPLGRSNRDIYDVAADHGPPHDAPRVMTPVATGIPRLPPLLARVPRACAPPATLPPVLQNASFLPAATGHIARPDGHPGA